jgi:superfamily II DNA or RNA helicase
MSQQQQQQQQQQQPAIYFLKFPFYLKKDQIEAVSEWVNNNFRGTILYSSGTGKTEIAFECAKRAAADRTTSAKALANKEYSSLYFPRGTFNIVFLVPRIVLINQNVKRLLDYGIPKERIGVYFGERKKIREITISTYHSVLHNPNLLRKSHMVIFDEVHLISDTAKKLSRIFDVVVEDNNKAVLGLTATIDEADPRYNTIMTVLPPVRKYAINDAVKDSRLARPIIIPLRVNLTEKEQKEYNSCSTKIKNISNRFKRYDAKSMSLLLTRGGFVSGMARAWFINVRKRKAMLACAESKLSTAIDLIIKKHPKERIMVFSETLDSINKLKDRLNRVGITSKIIDSTINSVDRQNILDQWGRNFYPLLSVHTLEIGYNIPQVRIEIILATTSNMNQAIQRIGRAIRKHQGKDLALIYVVYVSDTKDNSIVDIIKKAIQGRRQDHKSIEEKRNGKVNLKKSAGFEKRIRGAYNIIETSLYEPTIVEEVRNKQEKLFRIMSSKQRGKFYDIDPQNKTCSCPDYKFRQTKCKHILATELISTPLSS